MTSKDIIDLYIHADLIRIRRTDLAIDNEIGMFFVSSYNTNTPEQVELYNKVINLKPRYFNVDSFYNLILYFSEEDLQ